MQTKPFALLAVMVTSIFLCAGSHAAQSPRRPWEWTDEERLAARADAAAAAARVERAARTAALNSTAVAARPFDVIAGQHEPQLLLPFEVFDYMMRMGFAEDAATRRAYRAAKDVQRENAGLPSIFWDELESMTAPYRGSLARQRAGAAGEEVCRDRFDSLIKVTNRFGLSFLRFLYEGVAPDMTQIIFKKPNIAALRAQSGGCR